jgi:hypothetical protein
MTVSYTTTALQCPYVTLIPMQPAKWIHSADVPVNVRIMLVTALSRIRRFSIVAPSRSDKSWPMGPAPSDEIVMISTCRSRGTWAPL